MKTQAIPGNRDLASASAPIPSLSWKPQPGRAPDFSNLARGTPADWKKMEETANKEDPNSMFYWNKNSASKRVHHDKHGALPDTNVLLDFFQKRNLQNGDNCSSLLGPITRKDNGWYTCQYLRDEVANAERVRTGDWHRAWHGTRFYAIYSIVATGELTPSADVSAGHRILTNTPGIYCHKHATRCASYTPYMPLADDGIFWAVVCELLVDRNFRVSPPRKTDQWIQQDGSVIITAIWFHGVNANQMTYGSKTFPAWNPLMEANPTAHEA